MISGSSDLMISAGRCNVIE